MLHIKTVPQGLSIQVRVAPRAAQNKVGDVSGGVLKVRLTAPPVEGAANIALVKFLAKALGLHRRQVSLLSGHKTRNKRLLIQGLAPTELLKRLEQ